MTVELEVEMTPLVLYSYMLHQTYTGLKGMLSVILGIGAVLTGIMQKEAGSTISAALLIGIGAIIFVMPFILLWNQAKKKASSNKAFQGTIRYELSEQGVRVIQGETHSLNPWSDFQSAVSTGQSLILTVDKEHFMILPRLQIGEKWAPAVQVISTHMPPDRVRIRQVN